MELAASVELPDYVALARTSDILPGEGEPAKAGAAAPAAADAKGGEKKEAPKAEKKEADKKK